ncbi:MAG: hypothetical protein JWQ71_4580 [Pedosphaera sp.]|nr:hypothetical protein [Pedosphaera sp.]
MSEFNPKSSRTIIIVGLVWLLIALTIGYLRLLEPVPRAINQVILLVLTFSLLIAFYKSQAFHVWVMGLPLRALILVHVVRFVGFYFLFLYRRGELPYAFAVQGGWGDILVATTAIIVAMFVGAKPRRPYLVLAWNTLGLIDILMVVITAGRLGLSNPDSIVALTRLPLSLLPTFVVPLIIFTHIVIFYRVRKIIKQGVKD